jgi:hypothetical protein
MAELKQRKYYKIFTGSNQADGYDKIHLGYEATSTEILLKKDYTTYFHMPFFADITPIQSTTLVADGAIPGPIPALADRIYKKLGNYGNTTPWGTSTQRQDGTWLCSWLYAVSSEPPQWMDRYYNPGRLAYKEALEGRANFTDYYKSDPIYYDIPSALTLEPGVLYQYTHCGEKFAAEAVHTFSGNDNTKLRLNIDTWADSPLDSSIYKNTVTIKDFKQSWIESVYDPGYQDRNVLSFNHSDFVDAQSLYSNSYNLSSEFTLSMWVSHPNWANATSTQLVGNLQRGGYGLFYNNLYYNPFIAIPETNYGHLFFFNQETNFYYEKNIQNTLGKFVETQIVNLNSEQEVIGLVSDIDVTRLYKYDHLGFNITQSRDLSGGFYNFNNGTPKSFIIDQNNNSIVFTLSGVEVFDKDLLYKGTTYNNFYNTASSNTPYQPGERYAFDMEGKLHREQESKDVKFDIYNNKWSIKNDGNVYCNSSLVATMQYGATKLSIDPNNFVWVIGNNNIVYKISTITRTISQTFLVGAEFKTENIKSIGFIKSYDKKTNEYTWYAVISCNNEKTVYFVTLDGKIFKNIYLPPRLNIREPATSTQNPNALQFTCPGDFTGYEWKRVFNEKLYNNNPQVQFKISTKGNYRGLPIVTQVLSVPVQYLLDSVWNLITATFKNGVMKLYINNYLRDSIQIPQNSNLVYNLRNNLIFGCPFGEADNLNKEILTTSIIWNGYIDSVKIYDYALDPKFIQYLVREKVKAGDITWNIPTAALQYVEVVDRFFKHRVPGSKSQFFNIRLTGSSITDPAVKKQIEEDIKLAVSQIKPAYTELLQIEWIE